MKISFKSNLCRTRDSSVVRLKNGSFLEIRNGLWTWGHVPFFNGVSSKGMTGIPVRLTWPSLESWLANVTTVGSFFVDGVPCDREKLPAAIAVKKGAAPLAEEKVYRGKHELEFCDSIEFPPVSDKACEGCYRATKEYVESFLCDAGICLNSKNSYRIDLSDIFRPFIAYSFLQIPAGWTGGDPMEEFICDVECDSCRRSMYSM